MSRKTLSIDNAFHRVILRDDAYDYTNRAMLFDEPGSLTPDEVYSLVAFLLLKNEIIEEDVVMNADTLPDVVMPACDRFVPDNRHGGPELKWDDPHLSSPQRGQGPT